jgi:hypothetical protein
MSFDGAEMVAVAGALGSGLKTGLAVLPRNMVGPE